MLHHLRTTASAPPLAADPALSKDINAYFYGDDGINNGGSSQIVSHDHYDAEAPLGSGGSDANADMNVSPYAVVHEVNSVGESSRGGAGMPMQMFTPRGDPGPTSHTNHSATSPGTKSASAPLSLDLQASPVEATAVPTEHEDYDRDIAVAELYTEDSEEYKE